MRTWLGMGAAPPPIEDDLEEFGEPPATDPTADPTDTGDGDDEDEQPTVDAEGGTVV